MYFQNMKLFTSLSVIAVTILSISNANVFSNIDVVTVDTRHEVCVVSDRYLSVGIDTKFIFQRNLSKLLENSVFINMANGLQPAHLRIGGTASDLIVFEKGAQEKENYFTYKQLSCLECLSWSFNCKCKRSNWPVLRMSYEKWLSVNALASRAKLNLLFDLNVLLRQPSGQWNFSNAQELIEFSQFSNLTLDWQLGNEPNSFKHVFGEEVPPMQLAKDYEVLSKILKRHPLYHNSKLVGPDVTSPRGPKRRQIATLKYLDGFLSRAKNVINAASWHQYYLNGRNTSKEEFMDPSVFEVLRREIKDVRNIVTKNTDKYFPVWMTETATAFGGGAPGLSNSFVGGFSWLDKLGMAASYNISVVFRQSLVGGNYGLIDEKSLEPNANYWVSYIFKKLVGRTVLKLNSVPDKSFVRLYSHCHRTETSRTSIVIFGMNLGLSNFRGLIAIDDVKLSRLYSVEKYVLTSSSGRVTSRGIHLNGKELKIRKSGQLPPLKPVRAKTKFIDLPPQSIGFYVVKDVSVPVCRRNEMK